jgi:plastocyanin
MSVKGLLVAVAVLAVFVVGPVVAVYGYEAYRTRDLTVEILARAPELGNFSPREVILKANEPAKIRARNVDTVTHGFACPGLGIAAAEVKAGRVEVFELTPKETGRHDYYCTVWCSDHHLQMRGVIEVVAGAGVDRHEKLAFPLTVLPVELAEHFRWRTSIFADPIFWVGFALPTLVFTLNGIHGLRPSIPGIPVQYRLNSLVFNDLGRPWRDLGFTTAYTSMAAVGFGYFLPSQVLFSLWAFFVIIRVQNIAFSAFGAPREPMPLYPTTIWNGYQVAGAYLVLVGYMTRSAIPHLRSLWQAALRGRERMPDHSDEARPAPPRA